MAIVALVTKENSYRDGNKTEKKKKKGIKVALGRNEEYFGRDESTAFKVERRKETFTISRKYLPIRIASPCRVP